ncbi:hypothetical protein [Aureimonas sp. N4]|uniref:hypothetical protein n=1 Tax=Aureimonas sp. N4 TaxID=1638165 RepID=UPI0007815E28|nr:hypothetical protein [Aureimonas sp. N4]
MVEKIAFVRCIGSLETDRTSRRIDVSFPRQIALVAGVASLPNAGFRVVPQLANQAARAGVADLDAQKTGESPARYKGDADIRLVIDGCCQEMGDAFPGPAEGAPVPGRLALSNSASLTRWVAA